MICNIQYVDSFERSCNRAEFSCLFPVFRRNEEIRQILPQKIGACWKESSKTLCEHMCRFPTIHLSYLQFFSMLKRFRRFCFTCIQMRFQGIFQKKLYLARFLRLFHSTLKGNTASQVFPPSLHLNRTEVSTSSSRLNNLIKTIYSYALFVTRQISF